MATEAYGRLKRWLASDEPRALGDDATAAALAARAGLILDGGDDKVASQAIALVGAACRGNGLSIAPLHLAMSAWALDTVIPDRSSPPWDDIRSSLGGFPDSGVDGALILFARSLSDQRRPHCDARLAEPVPLDRTDECVLLWLVDAAINVEIDRGESDINGSTALERRRSELFDRLTSSLTPEHFIPALPADYDPEVPDEMRDDGLYLFEAALLDLVLSGDRPHQALVTIDEAHRIGAGDTRRLRRTYATAAFGLTWIITGLATAVAALAHGNAHSAVGTGLIVCSLGLMIALRFLRPGDVRWEVGKLMSTLLGEILVGIFLVVEGVWKTAVADGVAVLLAIAPLSLPFLLDAAGSRLAKK